MGNSHKIQVQIGPHKFTAEGPEQTVKEAFRLFLEHVAKADPLDATRSPKARESPPIGLPSPVIRSDGSVDFPASDWDRIFRVDQYGYVLLNKLPHSKDLNDVSSALLLVFGHCKINREETVRAPSLMYSLRLSDVPVERLDRAIGGYDHLFTTTGKKKGTRYGLTDAGLESAASLFKKLADIDREGEQGE